MRNFAVLYFIFKLFYLPNSFAQNTLSNGKLPQNYCISPAEKEKNDYVNFPKCNKHIKHMEKTIPSCAEFMVLLNRINLESHTLSSKEFNQKYIQATKNRSQNIVSIYHPLFKDIHQDMQNGIISHQDLAMLDSLAHVTHAEISKKFQEDIGKFGLTQAKAILRKTVGKGAHVLPLFGDNPEMILKDISVEYIKNSFLKQMVTTASSEALSFENIFELTASSTSKSWIKESLLLIRQSKGIASKEVLKSLISSLRIKLTPNLAMNIVLLSLPVITGASTYDWLMSKNENSLINYPELFSHFARNANFNFKGYTCEDLYLKTCNYYYWKACDSISSKGSFRGLEILENFAELRSKTPLIKEANAIAVEHRNTIQRDNTKVFLPTVITNPKKLNTKSTIK